jgi:16S rRNA (uracil1498-N3)-methyltransferase
VVEHDDRAPVGTFVVDTPLDVIGVVTLGDSAAHHARVKRLVEGDRVRVTDGAGQMGRGDITAIRRGSMEVTLETLESVPRPYAIHLRVPIGDRERMLWLAEKASELGATTWQAVRFKRSASVSPRGEGVAFGEKTRARMAGALEQSGGAWMPRLLPEVSVHELAVAAGELPIMLQADGSPLLSLVPHASDATPVLLFGPEGGMEPHERQHLEASGWKSATLATSTLRFETAGIAGLAVLRAAYIQREG